MFRRCLCFAAVVVALSIASMATSASASIVFSFGIEISGSGDTLSGPVVVTIDDGGGSGSVNVTIDTTGLDGSLSEHISALYLNLNPAIDPATLGVVGNGGFPEASSFGGGTDNFKADGDGFYDLLIEWPQNESDRFIANMTDVVTYTLGGLVEEDFDFLSTSDGSGPFKMVLRAGSLGEGADGSGWFAPGDDGVIPEPASMIVWGLLTSLGLCAGWRRRRRAA